MSDVFEAWKKQRNEILCAPSYHAAKDWLPPGRPEEVYETAWHKARYACTGIPESLRHASAKWLRDHGCTDHDGLPILPEGELPK